MNERDLWWKIALVGTLCALAFASVWPMEQKMKFGIDLFGGYSLLYEIDDSGLDVASKRDLSERVMKVLRERVDPKGVYNLVWRPVGHNRLEIQMPRPSEEVTSAREEFKKLQEELQATHVRRTDVLRAVAKQGPDRAAAFTKLVHGIGTRTTLLEEAGKVSDEWQKSKDAYDKRVEQIRKDNLSRSDVEEAIKKPIAARAAAFDALVRGIPQRRVLLDGATKALDELTQVAATTQPTGNQQASPEALKRYDEKKAAYESAIAKVLEANADPNKLTDGATLEQVVSLEEKFDAAVANVLATNVDVGKLQTVLDAKPTDSARADHLKKLLADFPGVAPQIDALVKANDKVRKQHRSEGRLEDPADLKRLLKGAGVLEFRILAEPDQSNPEKFTSLRETLKNRGPRRAAGEENFQWFALEDPKEFLKMENPERDFEKQKNLQRVIVERFGDKYYTLSNIGEGFSLTHKSGETDWSLKGAHTDRDEYGKPCIAFQLDERGGDKFATLTRLNKGRQLCIFLDDQAVSHATIQSVIRTSGRITGNFQLKEVQDMVKKLDAGSLPKKLKDPPISERSIGPSLGEANRAAGLRSAKIGAAAVAIFMLGYYYYAGSIAVIACGMNVLFTLAVMALMGATLTLPGIAGLVLSVGMAVDANVLINERIREELAKGTAMRMAIKLGYARAFSAILDSNVTTILTSVILYMLGSEEIKGFALTLGVGVVLNLFTAYFVTLMFFEIMAMFSVPYEVARYPWLFGLGVSAFGGLLYGLGFLRNDPSFRDQSLAILFGRSLMYVGPAVIGLLAVMWLARTIHASFQKGGKPRLPMQHWIGSPNWDWIGMRRYFFTFSILITLLSGYLFFKVKPQDLYDIEFLGGTAAQIDLKTAGALSQADILNRLQTSAETLDRFAADCAKAKVEGANGTFTIQTPGIPAARLEPIIKAVLGDKLSQIDPVTYSEPAAESVIIRTKSEANLSREEVQRLATQDFASAFKYAGEAIGNAQVQAVGGEGQANRSFEIVTLEKNKEVVVGAIMQTMQAELDIQPQLTFNLLDDKAAGGVPYFPIRTEDVKQLDVALSPQEANNVDLSGWKGGVAVILDQLNPPQKVEVLQRRLRSMRLQPGFEAHGWRENAVFGLTPASPGSDLYNRMMVVVADENYPLDESVAAASSAWASELAEPEVKLIKAALARQTSLSQVTQFDQQISREAQTNAYIAVILSWLVIIIYLWFRFGNIRWGLAAVVALVHDVLVGLGALGLSFLIAETPIGKWLLIDKFRVDMSVVAALLTVIGYSVNDTIIVFDRIRENKGRLPDFTPAMVNASISQTLSRTLLTVLTVMLTIVIMYIFGGRGIHGFNYVMMAGIATGTYSSFAIASQLLIKRRALAATKAG